MTRQQYSIAMEHGNRGALPKRDRCEEFFEIDGVDPSRHHSKKGPVRPAQPMGEDGGPAAGEITANRFG